MAKHATFVLAIIGANDMARAVDKSDVNKRMEEPMEVGAIGPPWCLMVTPPPLVQERETGGLKQALRHDKQKSIIMLRHGVGVITDASSPVQQPTPPVEGPEQHEYLDATCPITMKGVSPMVITVTAMVTWPGNVWKLGWCWPHVWVNLYVPKTRFNAPSWTLAPVVPWWT